MGQWLTSASQIVPAVLRNIFLHHENGINEIIP